MTPSMTRGARVALASLAAAALAGGAVSATASAAEPQPSAKAQTGPVKAQQKKDKLGSHDRELLAKARTKGDKRVTVMLATTKGSAKSVAAAVKAAGGFTAHGERQVSATSAPACPSAASTPSRRPRPSWPWTSTSRSRCPSPRPSGAGTASAAAVAGPGAGTPNDNPFMPTRDIGSVASRRPTPRGTAAGSRSASSTPVSTSTTRRCRRPSTGERKIVDWVTGTDPLLESDGSWRAMLTAVTGPDLHRANVAGTWTAPAAGTYKFNRVAESISNADEAAGDFNRDGDNTDRWGILYDETTHDIWVDANQDQTFSASEKMRPYKENFDVAHFGVDNPATAVAESMPFVVEYREDVDLTPAGLAGPEGGLRQHRCRPGRPRHARRGHRGRTRPLRRRDGRPGPRRQDRLEPRLLVGRRLHRRGAHRRHGRPGREPRRRRRQHVDRWPAGPQRRATTPGRASTTRLINGYGVQLVISAGNSGPGINTIGDPSVATNVVSVGVLRHQGDLAGQLRLGGEHAADAAQLLLARPA